MKLKLKPALVPICMFYFMLFFAFDLTYPYLSLQMMSLGLTMSDITLVVGFAPVIGFFVSPLLGYVGDKFGYKIVLIVSIIMNIIFQTSFNFLPVYRKFHHKIALNASFPSGNLSEPINQNDVAWLASYVENKLSCQNEYLNNMSISNIVCDEASYDSNFNFVNEDIINITSKECLKTGMDSCKFIFKSDVPADELIFCDVIFSDEDDITPEDGSHELTFWSYFTLRVLTGIMTNTLFNLADATSSVLARKERSSYSIMFLFGQIGSLLPQFIVGPIVDHISLGSSYIDCLTEIETTPRDYKIPFLIFDGILLIAAIFAFFFLDITVEKKIKKNVSLKEEFGWLANPAALLFYLLSLMMGMVLGAGNTFIFIYCQEVLGATTTFLGYMKAAMITTSICILPFGRVIMEKVGLTNTICMGIFMASAREVAWAFPFFSPPYTFLAYGTPEGFVSMYMVAVVTYVAKIAPPELTATGISLQSVLVWIVGKGIGALVAGQLVDAFSIKIMFLCLGFFGMCASVLYWIIYNLFLKKYELDYSQDMKENSADIKKSGIADSNYVSTGIFHTTHL